MHCARLSALSLAASQSKKALSPLAARGAGACLLRATLHFPCRRRSTASLSRCRARDSRCPAARAAAALAPAVQQGSLQQVCSSVAAMMDHFLREALCNAPPPSPAGAPAYISVTGVAVAAAVVAVNACVSLWLSLGLHWQLVVAAVRCVVQLAALGYVLVPIFRKNVWWLVLLYANFMLLVGCWEATSRPSYTYHGMLLHTLVSVGTGAASMLTYGLLLVIHQQPWWQAQYFIPILGMLLGNAISGVSIGLTTILEELSSGKDRVEFLLALGASRWEAVRDTVQRAVKVAMTPVLNQMNVVGIVSIPGMMTGQILSGSDPSQAARYQMIIMFLIAATTAVGSTGSIMSATFWILDSKHRLRSDRLHKRQKNSDGLPARLAKAAAKQVKQGLVTVRRLLGGELLSSSPAQEGGALSQPLLPDAEAPAPASGPTQGPKQQRGPNGQAPSSLRPS